MTTLKEIAEICHVSVSTVSIAINTPHKISEPVRARIYEALQESGYNKYRNKVRNIGLVCEHFDKYFKGEYYNEVIYGLIIGAANLHLNLKFLLTIDQYKDIYSLQGLVFVGKVDPELYTLANKFKIPYVTCGHPTPKSINIYSERIKSMQLLIDYVLNCGHREIALLIGDSPQEIIQKEFIQAVKSRYPEFRNDHIFEANYDNIQTVEIAWNKILSTSPKITAILCDNDLLAYYVYILAKKYQLYIPADISVTGFDGISFPRFITPPEPSLTTAITDRQYLGEMAIKTLVANLDDSKNENKGIQIASKIIIGNSVRRIAAS